MEAEAILFLLCCRHGQARESSGGHPPVGPGDRSLPLPGAVLHRDLASVLSRAARRRRRLLVVPPRTLPCVPARRKGSTSSPSPPSSSWPRPLSPLRPLRRSAGRRAQRPALDPHPPVLVSPREEGDDLVVDPFVDSFFFPSRYVPFQSSGLSSAAGLLVAQQRPVQALAPARAAHSTAVAQ